MQDGSKEEIKVQRCRNSPRCFHRLLVDMPRRDVREIQEGREIPLTVDLARLPPYLDLLEDCFQGKELARESSTWGSGLLSIRKTISKWT